LYEVGVQGSLIGPIRVWYWRRFFELSGGRPRGPGSLFSDPVGIDLERIQEHAGRLLEVVPTVGERALLATVSEGELNAWITRLWCAKEAVGKVLGMGVTDVLRRGSRRLILLLMVP